LFHSFVLKRSYSRILTTLHSLNSATQISNAHLSFYTKRFKLCFPKIRLFLLSTGSFAENPEGNFSYRQALSGILDRINTGTNFVAEYHSSLHVHFMERI
jgi:hypothetical protein